MDGQGIQLKPEQQNNGKDLCKVARSITNYSPQLYIQMKRGKNVLLFGFVALHILCGFPTLSAET